ncbi:MotA/TolQ/ExbB proton channel family protein [Acinetobacter qingfengensis]|uniref:Biopolymer transporter ExbB n=1 Tax=Acinetobacter qingfengensis TaxID=1262585 RepID=A0A1E7REV7_9GAMM|nr:MotA/TolQ/ExbB proton channel family protein [Acinetobacter qingfengensis]KAA8735650.1 MotA/TolQ/ExbB proton channel family protein [Acinetobacter qingfengensis]OEY97904.1 biopolymer transporter ExbB [Acinetobacter qingfengensis]
MWEFIKAGGWLMLPLVLCSIAALAIIIERFLRLKRIWVAPTQLCQQAILKLHSHQFNSDYEQQLSKISLGQILLKGYQFRQENPEFVKAQMQAEAAIQINQLEKNINFLGTIGSIAPLLGLLGTVLGIIEAFLAVNAGGITDPAMLANGVSKALITTAAGMIVAIPALIFYRYFQRLIVEYVVEMEQQATIFHAALFYDKSAKTQPLIQQDRYVGQVTDEV